MGRPVAGRGPVPRLREGRHRGRHHRGRGVVLLARLAPAGDGRGVWEEFGAFVHQQIIWVKDRADPDAVVVPVAARAVLHGLAPPEPPAEGGRADAALDMGDAFLRQGRAPRPPDAEAARRFRDPDAPACGARRALLRAFLGLRIADHSGRSQWPSRLRDGDQPRLCRCGRGTLAGRDRQLRHPAVQARAPRDHEGGDIGRGQVSEFKAIGRQPAVQ